MILDLGFAVIAAIILVCAVFVVRSKNLIHAVLWLALTLLGTAALYAMLDSPFLAGVQVLTYVGGIVTLMIFGVMVTRRHEGTESAADSVSPDKGFIAAFALFSVLELAIWKTPFPTTPAPPTASVAELSQALLGRHLLSFEAASLLLLAAIVGAVVLARRRDPDPVTGREPAAAVPTRQEVAP